MGGGAYGSAPHDPKRRLQLRKKRRAGRNKARQAGENKLRRVEVENKEQG